MLGCLGFQCVSNVQLVTMGNSPNASPVRAFQQIVLLSLPQERSNEGSCADHARDSIPCSCNLSVRSGAFEFRRSHIKMSGSWSFDVAVASFVELSGSQAIALIALRPRLLSVKLSFLALASHTVAKPPLLPVTRICATFLFQSRASKSSALATAVPSLNVFVASLRSLTYSSPFVPAVARSSLRKVLNWRDLIAPLCFVMRETWALLFHLASERSLEVFCPYLESDRSLSASHKSNAPLSKPPAIMPLV